MRKLAIILIIAFVFIIATNTNPTKDDFVNWAKEELKKDTNGFISWGIELLGDDLINSATNSRNYVIFSIYEVSLSETDTIRVLGLFNNFIPLTGSIESTPTNSKSMGENKFESEDKVLINEEQIVNSNIPILYFNNQIPIKNAKTFSYKEDNKEIPIKLKDGKGTLYFGIDHPNGIQIVLLKDGVGAQIQLEQGDEVLNEFGDFADIENYYMTVGTYDFNNDKNEEIIIAIGDNQVIGQMWVYSYHEVDDIMKINPFHMELTSIYQEKIWIDNKKIMIPYGSQGLFDEYIWYNDGFLQK